MREITRSEWRKIHSDYKGISHEGEEMHEHFVKAYPDWDGKYYMMIPGPALVPVNVVPDPKKA